MAEKSEKLPVATLVIVVTFDHIPDLEDLKGDIENLNGYGHIREAKLKIHTATEVDLR